MHTQNIFPVTQGIKPKVYEINGNLMAIYPGIKICFRGITYIGGEPKVNSSPVKTLRPKTFVFRKEALAALINELTNIYNNL